MSAESCQADDGKGSPECGVSSDTFLPVHEQDTHYAGGSTQSRVRLDGSKSRYVSDTGRSLWITLSGAHYSSDWGANQCSKFRAAAGCGGTSTYGCCQRIRY